MAFVLPDLIFAHLSSFAVFHFFLFFFSNKALAENKEHQVQIIDLSGNRMNAQSMETFSKAIGGFTHVLRVLNLDNCSLHPRGTLPCRIAIKCCFCLLEMQQRMCCGFCFSANSEHLI